MAFKMRSGNSSTFKMIGSSTPDSKPAESVADPGWYARQQQLEKEPSFKPYTGKDPDPRDKGDSLLENIVEFVDPTGISSWDDAYRAYNKEDRGVMDYVDMFGAVPLLGKASKIARATGKGFNLAKSASKTASAGMGSAASRLLNLGDTSSDIEEDNTK